MTETVGSFPYSSPHQMTPMLPGEHKLDALRLLAAAYALGEHECT